MSITSGSAYKIVNGLSGTVLDLSGQDNTSIIGYPDQEGPNQRWLVNNTEEGWTFQSARTEQYLSWVGTNITNGTNATVAADPTPWHVWYDQLDNTTFRLFAPFTPYNLDLYNYGDSSPGDPVTLWYQWAGVHQTWRFEEVEA